VEIKTIHEQGLIPVTVLQPIGDLDSDQELIAQAQAAYDNGARGILLHLSQVAYMSSIGLRAIPEIFLLLKSDQPDESREAMMEGVRSGTFTSPVTAKLTYLLFSSGYKPLALQCTEKPLQRE
jgi:hypothetical protein